MREVDLFADARNIPAVEDEYLATLGVLEELEGRVHGVHWAHGRLATQRVTELEQEVIPRRNGGDVDRRTVGRDWGAGGAGRSAL